MYVFFYFSVITYSLVVSLYALSSLYTICGLLGINSSIIKFYFCLNVFYGINLNGK